ncbi:MAG: hypothetical protein M3Q69_11555 [Acidobacteriota bacterium]|nr:hypothetical protein [Acidobacteriota bacterium]
MSAAKPPQQSWFVVVVAALLLAIVTASRFAFDALERHTRLADPAVVFIVYATGSALFLAIIFLLRRERLAGRQVLKPALLIVLTLASIAALQTFLAAKFNDLGWPREAQYYGSWLIAIVSVGLIAEEIRKRAGIALPRA